MRYELPENLTPEEERAVIAALERYFGERNAPPSPWAMAGRTDATGVGALQTKRDAPGAWQRSTRGAFARRGTPPLIGRGDAK